MVSIELPNAFFLAAPRGLLNVRPSKQPAPINFVDRTSDFLALAEFTHRLWWNEISTMRYRRRAPCRNGHRVAARVINFAFADAGPPVPAAVVNTGLHPALGVALRANSQF
jgi:hypothetical protein